ncbi:AP2/ERF domain - like 10 [Theobroma cacao]|nr:AP2/ERF domain - like 10 [Theobroma cacao]
MEMITAKSEMGPGRRRLCMAEGDNIEIKCMKRRRRDPSTGSLGCYNQQGEQQQQQGDQPTATTVKRSSRFRGVSDYEKEIEIMKAVTKEEYLASLRRRSSGFSRGVSRYRGVARHHHNGRWEARIGRVFGNKYLYLGTYGTQEEAAHAYDIAAIEYRGINAVTNFDLSTYIRWLKPGANQTTLVSQPMTASNPFPTEQTPDVPLFNSNPFTVEALDSPRKQDVLQKKAPVSPCPKSSSPTALSLLLRFKHPKKLRVYEISVSNHWKQ